VQAIVELTQIKLFGAMDEICACRWSPSGSNTKTSRNLHWLRLYSDCEVRNQETSSLGNITPDEFAMKMAMEKQAA
jgi:hypothetical protein